MRRDRAEIVAIETLGWIVNAELLDTFQSATGADLATIRAAAADPAFLGAVLDFVLGDDAWVRGAAEAQGLQPEAMLAARAALPGGDLPHWT